MIHTAPMLKATVNCISDISDESIYELQNMFENTLSRKTAKLKAIDLNMYFGDSMYLNPKYEKIANGTINKNISYFRGYLSFIFDKRYTAENFSLLLVRCEVDAAENQKQYLEMKEIKILLDNCEGDLNLLIRVMFYSGIRPSELFKGTISEVDNVNCIDLLHPIAKLKTANTKSLIPIHSEISDLTVIKLEEMKLKYSYKMNYLLGKVIS